MKRRLMTRKRRRCDSPPTDQERAETSPKSSCRTKLLTREVHGGVVAERWCESVWLGKRSRTEQHVVARVEGGVVV